MQAKLILFQSKAYGIVKAYQHIDNVNVHCYAIAGKGVFHAMIEVGIFDNKPLLEFDSEQEALECAKKLAEHPQTISALLKALTNFCKENNILTEA